MNLEQAARQEMIDHGFDPDFPPEAVQQAGAITAAAPAGRDLTGLLWSSIDNDDSRDLDQVEWAERDSRRDPRAGRHRGCGRRGRKGHADRRARRARNHHGLRRIVRTFPMLPERLSTDLTSLSEGEDRAAVVIEFVVAADGSIARQPASIRRWCAIARSSPIARWGRGSKARASLRRRRPTISGAAPVQNEAAHVLRQARDRMGALTFDRKEVQPVVDNGHVRSIATRASNRAGKLIEDFMIAANEVMARDAAERGRVVDPARREGARALAAHRGTGGAATARQLPAEPDARALNAFLLRRKQADPVHYPDVSLVGAEVDGAGRVRADAARR